MPSTREAFPHKKALTLALCATLVVFSPLAAAERDVETLRRPPKRSVGIDPGRPRLQIVRADLPAGGSLEVEPKSVDFGRIESGEEREIRAAFAVRVLSDRTWVLKIARSASVTVTGSGATIPTSRLQVRSDASRPFIPLESVIELGRGKATGEAGELIIVDLRLSLDTEDTPGDFEAVLDITVEPV